MTTTVLPATPERWSDIQTIFGTRGDPSWCQCRYFLDPEKSHGEERNRQAFHDLVHQPGGRAPGLVAYRDGDPAGWVQVGPTAALARFTPRGQQAGPGEWAITCFVVRHGHRRAGISAALVDAAVKFARDAGATTLRARPSDTTVTRKTSADLFTGVLSTFLAANFAEIARVQSRVLVERDLRA